MVRPYAIKGHKRKKREENYDREEVEQLLEEETAATATQDEKKAEEVTLELPGIPLVPSNLNNKTGVTFILERACLEVAKVGKSYQLLSSEDHANFLRKNNKNPAEYRPDILHQALLTILDSPLNKAGRLRAVYVRTEKGVLLKLSHMFAFQGHISGSLGSCCSAAVGKREKLLRVIKNPVTQYLPVNSRKIGFSYSSEKSIPMRDYVAAVSDDVDLVFVVGAMAHGKISNDYTDDFIAISGYPLSAAWCTYLICGALMQKWNIF
ncbi:hypothetical protein AAG906_004771 [Vitis piasezkii]